MCYGAMAVWGCRWICRPCSGQYGKPIEQGNKYWSVDLIRVSTLSPGYGMVTVTLKDGQTVVTGILERKPRD